MPSAPQKLLLDLLGAALFRAELPDASGVDWDAVFQESLAQCVQPIAYAAAQPILPPTQQPIWKRAAAMRLAQNIACRAEYAEAADCLRASGAPFLMLKGTVSARYYPSPELRTMGDVDFLVPDAEREAIEPYILQFGFTRKKGYGDESVDWNYRRPPQSRWEMHAKINGVPPGKAGAATEALLADLFSASEIMQTPEGNYPVPSAFHHGLILLLHTAHHLTSSGLGLRHLCDWAVFVAAMPDGEFFAEFREKTESIGLWRLTQVLTRCAERALYLPRRTWTTDADDALADALTEDLLQSGNFGIKDRKRVRERNYMLDRLSSQISSSSPIVRIFRNITAAAKRDFPQSEKHAILLPAAWCATAARCTAELLKGKRTLGDGALRRSAEAHRKLFAELALFERRDNRK